MQLAVSIVALVLSVVSITWQVAIYRLTGGRARVTLLLGAVRASGRGMVTGPVGSLRGQADRLAGQGYVRPIIAVKVTNVGRMPVSVERWSLCASPGGMEYVPVGAFIGPALPHRLEAGTSETWATDLEVVKGLAAVSAVVSDAQTFAVHGKVELADERKHVTREAVSMSRPSD